MKKFLKQTFAYSLVFGVLALVTPVTTVAAQSVKELSLYGINTAGGVKSLNLYGIDTGRVAATTTNGLSDVQVAAIILSVIVGLLLIANGKFLKRVLSK